MSAKTNLATLLIAATAITSNSAALATISLMIYTTLKL